MFQLLYVAAWSAVPVFDKLALRRPGVTEAALLWVKYVIGAAVVVTLAAWTSFSSSTTSTVLAALRAPEVWVASVLAVGGYITYFRALSGAQGVASVALLNAAVMGLSVLAGAILLGERCSLRQAVGIAIVAVGTCVFFL